VTARIQAVVASEASLPFLTPRETAVILRRSVKSLYRLMDADAAFPKTRLPGGGLLIPRLALEQWLRDRTEGMRGPLRLAVVPATSTAPQRTETAGALNGAAS
jgi:hypothetical protein